MNLYPVSLHLNSNTTPPPSQSTPAESAPHTMLEALPKPSQNIAELAREEKSFTFVHFTCEHA